MAVESSTRISVPSRSWRARRSAEPSPGQIGGRLDWRDCSALLLSRSCQAMVASKPKVETKNTPMTCGAPALSGSSQPSVQVTATNGTDPILDAGPASRTRSGDRRQRSSPARAPDDLHLDQIQDLTIFAQCWTAASRSGVADSRGRTVRERLARSISNPLSPIEARELPANVTFADTPPSPWQIGSREVTLDLVRAGSSCRPLGRSGSRATSRDGTRGAATRLAAYGHGRARRGMIGSKIQRSPAAG